MGKIEQRCATDLRDRERHTTAAGGLNFCWVGRQRREKSTRSAFPYQRAGEPREDRPEGAFVRRLIHF